MVSNGSRAAARSQRQQAVMDFVVSRGSASAADLATLTKVSLMTVHRDIDELVERGMLRRYRGGVSAQPSSVFESNIKYRLGAQVDQKAAIARKAVELIEPGTSIMMDDSTTALALARILTQVTPLTVVTNYLGVVQELRDEEAVQLIVIGGEYSRTHDSFIGAACLEAIERFAVDQVFLSTSAMSATMTYHQEQQIVLVKRAMIRSATHAVLLMDSGKIPKTALHLLAPITEFDHVVVDAGIDPALVSELRERTDLQIAALDADAAGPTRDGDAV
ncbi:DeoR/GlpR family DNA-binding transcription regulator [Pseudonocardia sp.]|jgi:DeoR/GlpR family transcriptional regulator of sugar metabolism|uniref:DeoR/GlpR family DNA-binding transcription regulator n=1 Tax=Pseudonocardia sp. TaxID=60912 RepID=UPI00260E86AA|nr:DeoR/GlpR family DNA-binding transcription regulator [Pseudonocardia sp.]MCW2719648.1 transcriptional regulator of sugar metabolism [Pseudonocardia sp.]MDT7617523.1 hypothetical protein [Pseudonocardiales bacterium]